MLSHLTLCLEGLASLTEARQEEVLSLVFKHLDRKGGFVLVEEEGEEKDWEALLRATGFKGIEIIWRFGRLTAMLATK